MALPRQEPAQIANPPLAESPHQQEHERVQADPEGILETFLATGASLHEALFSLWNTEDPACRAFAVDEAVAYAKEVERTYLSPERKIILEFQDGDPAFLDGIFQQWLEGFVSDCLDFSNLGEFELRHLPACLSLSGDLNLTGTKITELPPNLHCASLILSGTKVERIPDGLRLDGDLILDGCEHLRDLPKGLKVPGNLRIHECGIQALPDDLEVGGRMEINFCNKLQKIGENLRVGDTARFFFASIETLPATLKVGNMLELRDCGKITELPSGLEIGGLFVQKCDRFVRLPDGFSVGGDLILSDVPMATLPEDLRVGGYIHLEHCLKMDPAVLLGPTVQGRMKNHRNHQL